MGSKKGGSQLAQLRSGLRDAGITTSKPKKGKKEDRDDRVAQYRKEQRRKRLDSLMTSLNAFDERTARSKNDVLGRKVKGPTGRPGVAKSGAIQLRREKLLPELEGRHRSSSFVDRRFGEYNPNLSLEDKMLQRFTHERQNRTNKASLFDLNDDEELGLTHYGQSLSGLDEMPDVRPDDEEEQGTYAHAVPRMIRLSVLCRMSRKAVPVKVLLEIAEARRTCTEHANHRQHGRLRDAEQLRRL